MPPDITAAILHLSDLHLGKDFRDEGSKWRSSGLHLRSAVNWIYNRGTVMQAHDSFIFTGLPTEIHEAARAVGAPEEEFDFHVATGDISTDADPAGRFDFAYQYLTGRVQVDDDNSYGLDLHDKQLFCVPGNHDKMERRTADRYLARFETLPERPPYVVDTRARSGQRFIFFGIDSNLYKKKTWARGLLEPTTFGWLSENLRRYGQDDASGKAVRILLLHHHVVDLNQFVRQSRWASYRRAVEGRYTLLQEADRILGLCKDRVDIIMHGHEHFPIAFRDPKSGCVVISAGTASEFQVNKEHRNSFHTVLFYGRRFEIVRFDWNKARFLPCLKWSGDLDARWEELQKSDR